MKKKHVFSRRSLLLVGALALVSSCQDYEPFNEQDVQDRAYTHEFVKQFGEIDPNQDWDLFGQLARHIGPATRAGEDAVPSVVLFDKTMEIEQADHSNYTKILPEINIPNNSYANSNLGRVTQDFLTSAREIELFPVHWTTSATDAIGIYWYVDEEGEGVKTLMGKDDKMYYIKEYTILENHKTRLEIAFEYNDGHKASHYIDGVLDVKEQFLTQQQMADQGIRRQYLISHGYKITVPNEISEYGFWIKNLGSGLDERYSEWNLNSKPGGPIEDNGDHMSYTATFNLSSLVDESGNPLYPNDQNQYLCFEDWINWGDADLNDLVFIAEGLDFTNIKDNNTIYENALLVCEDLSSYDFDFNDIVLDLTFKEEEKRIYEWVHEANGIAAHWELKETEETDKTLFVKPMAAGGAYETELIIGILNKGEIHSLMGETGWGGNPKRHEIINAGATYSNRSDSIPYIMPMGYEWKIGNGEGKYATHLSQLFAEGFIMLKCLGEDPNGKSAEKIITSGKINLDPNSTTAAPQMMLLPKYFEWPREEYPISNAYRGFNDWVSDITKTSWILDTQVADSITDRGDLKPDNPEEQQNHNLIETIEVPIQKGQFIYDDPDEPWIFDNAYFVSLLGIESLTVDEQSKADIIVHYVKKYDVYIDDADGNLLVNDNFGTGGARTTTYTLSPRKFNQALNSGGIWIIPEDDQADFEISKVEIKLYGATDPNKRHKLVVDPMSVLLDEIGQTITISASSETHANISYQTSNANVATIDANGVIRAQGVGSCDIIVTAQASNSYSASQARVKVVVDKTPTLTLQMSDPVAAPDFEGLEWTYDPQWGVADEDLLYPRGSTHTTYDHVQNITVSNTHDLSTWTNGAVLSFHFQVIEGDWTPQIFHIKNPAGNIIAGNDENITVWEGDRTYEISYAYLQSCMVNGECKLTIEYRTPPTSITSATLTKKATQ